MKASNTAAFEKQLIAILKETLASGGPVHLNVISQSMSPLLITGDTVIVEHGAKNNYQAGDIIVFENYQSLFTHRLLAKQKDHWLTKGDNALKLDPPLKPDLVLGRVCAIQKKGLSLERQSQVWQNNNRTIAKINLCQVQLLNFVDRIISQIFGEKQIRGVSLLHKLLAFPFRLATKLLILGSFKI